MLSANISGLKCLRMKAKSAQSVSQHHYEHQNMRGHHLYHTQHANLHLEEAIAVLAPSAQACSHCNKERPILHLAAGTSIQEGSKYHFSRTDSPIPVQPMTPCEVSAEQWIYGWLAPAFTFEREKLFGGKNPNLRQGAQPSHVRFTPRAGTKILIEVADVAVQHSELRREGLIPCH